LKLLAYFWSDVLVARIEISEVPLEHVNLVKAEIAFAERLHAFHDIEQPAARFRRFVSKEKRPSPFRKNGFLRTDDSLSCPTPERG
jgi:hypothetical protein